MATVSLFLLDSKRAVPDRFASHGRLLMRGWVRQSNRAVSGSSVPALWLNAIGFGLYLGWSMIGASASLLSEDNRAAIVATTVQGGLERVLWVLALVVAAVCALRLGSSRLRSVLVAVAGLGSAAGTAAVYIACAKGVDSSVLSFLRAPLIVSSLFIVLWGERLCRFDERQSILCVASASLISFALVFLSIPLTALSQGVLHVLMPVASSVLFLVPSPLVAFWQTGFRRTARNGDIPDAPPMQTEGRPALPLQVLFGLGLFGTAIVLLQLFSEDKTDSPNELMWLLAGVAVDACVLVVISAMRGNVKASSLSRPILPLFVVGTFLVFATDFGQQTIEVFIVACAWAYFRLFTWVIWRVGALKSNLPPLCAVAAGQTILTCGTAMGDYAHSVLVQMNVPGTVLAAVICTACVVVSVYLLDTRHIAEFADDKPLFDPDDGPRCERCIDVATARFGLSNKERAVARLLIQGLENESIQAELFISRNTLRTHLRNLYRKTGVHSREELVVFLRQFS